jgi:integrase|tara:strand:- start:11634 stop:12269 length:636 start_codon:yes stop_codon:yes gene_type:complete
MPNIKDLRYREFLDTGLINVVTKQEFELALSKIENKHTKESRMLCTLLYYSGRRPSEILELQGKDLSKEGNKLRIIFKTKKKGTPSILFFPLSNPYFKELLEYWQHIFESQWLFFNFRSIRQNKVKYAKKDGETITKVYERTTLKVYYWVKKWFDFTPYVLRHSRFSVASMKGFNIKEIMYLKGSKDERSVFNYLHLSPQKAKRLSKLFKD